MLANPLNQYKTCFNYDLSLPHSALNNTETTNIIQFIKESKNIELDYLLQPEGYSLSPEISQWLDVFCTAYALNYAGPVLLFSTETLVKTFKFLQSLQTSHQVQFLMAAKSMNESAIFNTASQYLAGFDVSNQNEYNLLPNSLENKIVFVTAPLLSQSLSVFSNKNNKLCFTINSIEQYEQFYSKQANFEYCIRLDASELLNQFYESLGEKTYASHFGVSPNNLIALKKMINPYFRGFHMHSGKAEGNLPQAYELMAEKALMLAAELNVELQYLNLGGGIVYLSNEELAELIVRIRKIVPVHIQLYFEPGRFLTKNAGYAVTRIASVNHKNTFTDIILDISSQCNFL